MSAAPPIPHRYEGEGHWLSLRPALADRHFVIGQVYSLVEHQQRSSASHNHYFAALHEAWINLPEHEAERFPTEDHLRKWCLIKAGFADQKAYACPTRAEAIRSSLMAKAMDSFAVVTVLPGEAVVRVFTAQSQSLKAMGSKEVFQRSKQAVLDIVAGMIGVAPETLSQNAARAA